MNSAGIKAIEDALGISRDNLRRAEQQKKQLPLWKDGNGINIDSVIRQYKKEEQQLLEALAEAQGSSKQLFKDIQTCERG